MKLAWSTIAASGNRQARINNYVGTSTRKISSFGVFLQNQRAVHRAPMLAHGSLHPRSILSRLGPAELCDCCCLLFSAVKFIEKVLTELLIVYTTETALISFLVCIGGPAVVL